MSEYNTRARGKVKRATQQTLLSDLAAVESIFAARPRAHIVVMKPPPAKTPAWRGWNRKRPRLEAVLGALQSGHGVGLIPHSIGAAVIDIDAGNPAALQQAHPPLVMLNTRRGAHAYFDAGFPPPPNRNGVIIIIDGEELKVDVVVGSTPQTRRYVVVHPGGLPVLAAALSAGTTPPPFPRELFDAPTPAARRYNECPVRMQRHWIPPNNPGGRIDFPAVMPGARNHALFAACCRGGQAARALWKAGKIKTQADLLHAAMRWNLEMPMPLSTREVERIVDSAWKYLPLDAGGFGRDYYTHDSESQARRAHIRAAKHNAAVRPQVEAAHALQQAGMSGRQIAAELRIPLATIQRWLKAPLAARRGQARPAAVAG